MKLKDSSVNIKQLDFHLKLQLKNVENACKTYNGHQYEMTVTSGNDGNHMYKSLHFRNRAIDIRTRDMLYIKETHLEIKRTLGKDFDVILEKDHIHIEYDPK